MSINILHVFTSFTPIATWRWAHRSRAVPRACAGGGPRPGGCQVLPALLPCALWKGKGACGAPGPEQPAVPRGSGVGASRARGQGASRITAGEIQSESSCVSLSLAFLMHNAANARPAFGTGMRKSADVTELRGPPHSSGLGQLWPPACLPSRPPLSICQTLISQGGNERKIRVGESVRRCKEPFRVLFKSTYTRMVVLALPGLCQHEVHMGWTHRWNPRGRSSPAAPCSSEVSLIINP